MKNIPSVLFFLKINHKMYNYIPYKLARVVHVKNKKSVFIVKIRIPDHIITLKATSSVQYTHDQCSGTSFSSYLKTRSKIIKQYHAINNKQQSNLIIPDAQ